MAVEEFRQTINDTNPLEIRLAKNGAPFDLTGWTCRLYVYKLGKKPIVYAINAAVMTNDPDQVANRGVVSYTFSPADYLATGPGYFAARIVATKGADVKTFPTAEVNENYFQINFLRAV